MIDKSEKFVWLVRVGYFSRAIFYSALGLIALTGADAISRGAEGIFGAIERVPAGVFLLWVMVIGLLAYAAFRACSLVFDIEHNGADTKGWLKRIGHGGSAIGHLALAWTAYKFATGPGGGDNGTQEAAAGVLSFSFGGAVVGLLGLAFLATAAFQLKKSMTAEFMQRISPGAPAATRWLGRLGYAARAVVYTVIGWSLIRVGFFAAGTQQIRTLGDAVASLAGQGTIFTITAAGMLLFGLFSFVLARYRIIPEFDLYRRVPRFRS